MPTEIDYNEEKLKELMLYVSDAMADDPSFGATMLNKVLFFADFRAYREYGSPITGARYFKLDNGPAPRRLLPCQEQLYADGRAIVRTRKRGPFTQRRLVAIDVPNLDVFTGKEIALVDEVILDLRGKTAAAVSRYSHTSSVGWMAAEMREDIPYPTAFLAPPKPPTPTQERQARELAAADARGTGF
jgi:antitoxin SocA-like protein